MQRILCFLVLICLCLSALGQTVWQLGTRDDSTQEFQYYYHAWEYGSAPYLRNHPAMDHQTGTFTYVIDENRDISNPQMVNGISTGAISQFMDPREVVSGLRLKWQESQAGNRTLIFRTSEWENNHQGENGIRVYLPGNLVKVFNLPDGNSRQAGAKEFSVSFPVKPGENEAEIRIVTRAKHYQLKFDYLKLETAEGILALPPVVDLSFMADDHIFHPDDAVKCRVDVHNLDLGTLEYNVKNFDGKIVKSSKAELQSGQAELDFPTAERGLFWAEIRLGEAKAAISYAVIEPVTLQYLPDSRFGCHAINGDGYATNPPRRDPDREELKARRAALAGARWARYHCINWGLREPEKGKYQWDYLDDKLALAEKYKLCLLLNIAYIPPWASPSEDKKLTICGEQRRLAYAPVHFSDWQDFLKALVMRCKGKVQWYELGNEPGYSSAFWSSGSAPEFGEYLRTGYEAIKAADPEAKVLSGAPLNEGFFEEVLQSENNRKIFDYMSIHYPGNIQRDSVKTKNWQQLLEKHNLDAPIINSEDMNWRNGDAKTVRDIASDVVKSYVRDAAQGIVKTFGFQMFDDNSSSRYSFFDFNENPYPAYPAYRAMTHRLEGAKYLGNLSGWELEAYLFDRSGTPIIVFWSDKDETLNLPLGDKKATLVSGMDVEQLISGNNGIFTVKSTPFPQYIEGGNIRALSALSETLGSLPRQLIIAPGKTNLTSLRIPDGVKFAGLQLPSGWRGNIKDKQLEIAVPPQTDHGIYEAWITLDIDKVSLPCLLLVEVGTELPGGNLVVNGNFDNSSAFWFGPADKAVFNVSPGAGVDGTAGAKIKGNAFFGCAQGFKIRTGERYLIAYDLKGIGSLGVVYTITDQNGKVLYPAKPGINALFTQATPEWTRYSEIISIASSGAAQLKLALLANHGKPEGELQVDNITVARLANGITPNKILFAGEFGRPVKPIVIDGDAAEWESIAALKLTGRSDVRDHDKTKWSGPDDLSGEVKMMMDDKNAYFLFFVRDNVTMPGSDDLPNAWNSDSVQFAVDPLNEGKYSTSLQISRDVSGQAKVYKHTNFWTPELPDNLTRQGVVPAAEAVAKAAPGGMIYEARIPLTELYPLKSGAESIGFSFLLNDDDGNGRKYMEWSGGIGDKKDPAQYGVLHRKNN